jgi:release factor glutamine methyltransferase
MTTLGDARAQLVDTLRASGVASPEAEVSTLLEALTGLSRSEQSLRRHRPLEQHLVARLSEALRRRVAGEPLQLVLGATSFYGVSLTLRAGVLVPRPETERLVELVLQHAPPPAEGPWRVVDVGCGSGAIALALAAERPDAEVVACDVDDAAVTLARENARPFGARVRVVQSDLLLEPSVRAAAGSAALLVANLPYLPEDDSGRLPPEVVAWEPAAALVAGPDGLAVARRLLRQALATLLPGASVWLELDPRNARALRAEAASCGWIVAPLESDLSGRPRFLPLRAPPRSAGSSPRPAAGGGGR